MTNKSSEFTNEAKKSFDKFKNLMNQKKQILIQDSAMEEEIRKKKNKDLIPIRQLLKQIEDMQLLVSNASRYSGGTTKTDLEPVLFRVNEKETSNNNPHLYPGRAVCFSHPADVEIAIPNESEQNSQGVIKINCATDHPDRGMLVRKFDSIQEACDVLAEFIAKHVVS